MKYTDSLIPFKNVPELFQFHFDDFGSDLNTFFGQTCSSDDNLVDVLKSRVESMKPPTLYRPRIEYELVINFQLNKGGSPGLVVIGGDS